ncbi:MAG: hypothetical protein IT376_15940 [Polyangiaceae bacterium]|nr:hypothetical protein [Polyangiaceae bacterium]
MSEDDPEKRSKRAERRKQRAEADAPPAGEVHDESDGAERPDDDSEPDPAGDEASAEGGSPEEEPAPRPRNRRERRAAKARGEEELDAEEERLARDRNRRMRQQRSKERQRERTAAVAAGLDASEMVDDAFTRFTAASGKFLRQNATALQWAALLAVAGGLGWTIWSWRADRVAEATTLDLTKGLAADTDATIRARVERAQAATDYGFQVEEVYPVPPFPDETARLQAAEAGYRATTAGSGPAAVVAKLGLAGVLYDQGKWDEAKSTYEAVKATDLARRDVDVRARCIEGIAFALEAKGDADAAEKVFRELEALEVPQFTLLGLYHRARLTVARGQTDAAKALIQQAKEKLDQTKDAAVPTAYLQRQLQELEAVVDPAVGAALAAGMGELTPETLAKLEQIEKQVKEDPTKLQELLRSLGKLEVPRDLNSPPPAPAPVPPAPIPAPVPSP